LGIQHPRRTFLQMRITNTVLSNRFFSGQLPCMAPPHLACGLLTMVVDSLSCTHSNSAEHMVVHNRSADLSRVPQSWPHGRCATRHPASYRRRLAASRPRPAYGIMASKSIIIIITLVTPRLPPEQQPTDQSTPPARSCHGPFSHSHTQVPTQSHP
jgi:hypothetical protein